MFFTLMIFLLFISVILFFIMTEFIMTHLKESSKIRQWWEKHMVMRYEDDED